MIDANDKAASAASFPLSHKTQQQCTLWKNLTACGATFEYAHATTPHLFGKHACDNIRDWVGIP